MCACVGLGGLFLGVNSSSVHDRDTCWERRGREKTKKKKLKCAAVSEVQGWFQPAEKFPGTLTAGGGVGEGGGVKIQKKKTLAEFFLFTSWKIKDARGAEEAQRSEIPSPGFFLSPGRRNFAEVL